MNRIYHASFLALLFIVAGLMPNSAAAIDTPTVIEYRVTASSLYETTPSPGNDDTQDLVVYTAHQLLNTGFFDYADIYYRFLAPDGAPVGVQVQVTANPVNDMQNDANGGGNT